ncbi:MAG TPA: ribonuclease P protein component [Chitinophagales bacterium]|nr:ribonuclease P protein component [Chitinophagales bacterium]HPW85799.1 ribonuclease P protein component [Chitinophagales bacterium]HQO32197.1 ribonuclease P protein component [Chitinophagales bacterium]HQO90334.1 ribonuclease P protein component [Chitinophagales bacterium]
MQYTFSRDEKLKSRKLIEQLFSTKSFVQNTTIRIYYKELSADCAFRAQFAFVVSKRIFPLATDRNRIKRLMRESVRLQKPELYEQLQEKKVILLFSFHQKRMATFSEIDMAIKKLLPALLTGISATDAP